MIVRAENWGRSCGPVVEDVEPELRRLLMTTLLIDLNGQEDLYLSFIAKAESGETILDLYNQHIDAQLYPDGRVILEELRWSDDDEAERGPPARTEITLAEAKQLILDWLAAKQEWRAQKAATHASTATGSATNPPGPTTPTNRKTSS